MRAICVLVTLCGSLLCGPASADDRKALDWNRLLLTGPHRSLPAYCRSEEKKHPEMKLHFTACPDLRHRLRLIGRARTATVLLSHTEAHYPLDAIDIAIETEAGWFKGSPPLCGGRGCEIKLVKVEARPVAGGEPLLAYTFDNSSTNMQHPEDDYDGRFLMLCAVPASGQPACLQEAIPLKLGGPFGALQLEVNVGPLRDGAVFLDVRTKQARFNERVEKRAEDAARWRKLLQEIAGEHALKLPK